MPPPPEPTTLRAWVQWYITPLVPSTWRIIPGFKEVETPSTPTVNITYSSIDPHPTTPASNNLVNELVIRITDPHTDVKLAEDDVDDQVLTLIYALKNSARIIFRGAKKVKPSEAFLAWDITVTVITTKTP